MSRFHPHPNSLKNLRPIKKGDPHPQPNNSGGRPSMPFDERARQVARSITTESRSKYYAPLVRCAIDELQRKIEMRIHEESGRAPASETVQTGIVVQRNDEGDAAAYRGRLTALMVQALMSECPLSKDGETWESLIVLRTLTLALKGNPTALREVWTRMDGRVELGVVLSRGSDGSLNLEDIEDEAVNRMSWTQVLKARYQKRVRQGMSEAEASRVHLEDASESPDATLVVSETPTA